MDFRVPQFIEHDPKILGPLTLSQAIYVGSAIIICYFLKYYIGQNDFLYILVCGLIVGASFALAFIKIEGQGLPAVGKNFSNYAVNSKLYIWKRKEFPVFLSSLKKNKNMMDANKKQNNGLGQAPKINHPEKIKSLNKKINFGK